MNKEYLSQFVGYTAGACGSWYDMHIILIRKEWWKPNVRIKYINAQKVGSQAHKDYLEAVLQVKKHFIGE